jgi:hypothetical protein
VAVGLGPGDELGGDVAARAAAVLDHHGLAEPRLELFGGGAGEDVATGRLSVSREPAGGEGDDEADRAGGRPELRIGGGGEREEGGNGAPGERGAVGHDGSSRWVNLGRWQGWERFYRTVRVILSKSPSLISGCSSR